MSNNRTFFKNVKEGHMSLKDIFSDVLKKHTPEESARVLIAGTPLTTPEEADMLSGWQKPFLFARFFLVTAIVTILGMVLFIKFSHPLGIFITYVTMSIVVTITLLILVWEMNVPRNISLYEVLKITAVGGILSIIATLILSKVDTSSGAQWAPLTEEPAKVLIIYLLLMKKDRKYVLNGMLLGMAVGTGFAAMETFGYIMNYALSEGLAVGLGVALRRALVAINGHGIWAAMEGGALVLAKGDDKLRPGHLLKKEFLAYFAVAFALHYLHNSDIGSSMGTAKYGVLSVLALAVFLFQLKTGVNQIVGITTRLNGGRVTMAVNREASPIQSGASGGARLEFVSGPVSGKSFPVAEGQSLTLGRGSGCDIVLSGASSVSGTHCAVRMSGGSLTVTDLGSTNGTFLSDRRLSPNQSVPLTDGAVVSLGNRNCAFRVHLR